MIDPAHSRETRQVVYRSLIIIVLSAFCVHADLASAADVHVAVAPDAVRVEADSATVHEVLARFAAVTGLRFEASAQLPDERRSWQVDANDLETAVDRLLQGYNHIMIYNTDVEADMNVLAGAVVMAESAAASAGGEPVRLEVTIEEPVPGEIVVFAPEPAPVADEPAPAEENELSAEELLRMAHEPSRLRAVAMLTRQRTEEAVLVLAQVAIGDKSPAVKRAAFDGLKAIGSDLAIVFVEATERANAGAGES